jgi:ABC-type molybdate transport system ATPase subunit
MATLHADLSHPLRSFDLELSLELEHGALALVGPSGAGKSSVLRAVAGLLRPARGRISLGDETWLDTTRGIDVPVERRSVGLVFQDYALFPHLSVRRNVRYGADDRRSVDPLLERFRVAPTRGRTRSRVASASGSPSHVPSPAGRASFSSTSRSRRSTRTRGRRFAGSFTRFSPS